MLEELFFLLCVEWTFQCSAFWRTIKGNTFRVRTRKGETMKISLIEPPYLHCNNSIFGVDPKMIGKNPTLDDVLNIALRYSSKRKHDALIMEMQKLYNR